MRVVALTILFLCTLLPARSQIARGDNFVHATLLSDVSSIKPGQSFHVGVLFKIAPDWHIYWTNPGDSGLATTVKLNLPPGFTSGPVEYPFPTNLELPGNIANYAYENETMLIIPVKAPIDLPTSTSVSISAKVHWLVCKESCIPGAAAVDMQLPVSADNSPANSEIFQKWAGQIPASRDPVHVADVAMSQTLTPTASLGLRGSAQITVRWKTVPSGIQWFPDSFPGVVITGEKVITQKNTTTITYQVDASADAEHFRGIDSVLVYTPLDGPRVGLTLTGHKN